MPMESSEGNGVGKEHQVVAIDCLNGSSKADEWNENMLQTGDIVEEIKIGGSAGVKSPFRNGRSGVQKLLHGSFRKNETSIHVRVRRGREESVELQACIVPYEGAGRKHQYMLRSINDPNYAVGFVDRTESECYALQSTRGSRVASALSRAQLQDGYVSYPWEKKMREFLPVPRSSSFLSLLLLPSVMDRVSSRYNDLEDTLARANAWLSASQASGVPIVFMNVQTEALVTKISGETASPTVTAGSLSDLSNVANASIYGFEDYHGVDIGVVRAVRLWYAPIADELAVEIELKKGDTRLGFAISRTDEGFIYISSVIDDEENEVASTRSGLRDLYRAASSASKLLVVSRVANEKVLPWMVSSSGAVRCFDTVSLSQKLSLHRHALTPIIMHIFMWDRSVPAWTGSAAQPPTVAPPQMSLPPTIQLPLMPLENLEVDVDVSDSRLNRDTAGEMSFRFHDFSLSNNWV